MKLKLFKMEFNFFKNLLLVAGLILLASTSSYAQCAVPTSSGSKVGVDYILCIDGVITTTPTINANQYVVVNVVKGFIYEFKLGNVFDTASSEGGLYEYLTIFNDSSGLLLDSKSSLTGFNTTSYKWTASLSGKIKILLSRGVLQGVNVVCTTNSGTGGPMSIDVNKVGNSQDLQTTSGVDSWIGHVYNWAGAEIPNSNAPTDPEASTFFTTTNYAGYYNIASEEFQENFGGVDNCIQLLSQGVNRSNMRSDAFAVRYRMKTNRAAGYYYISVNGDDGVRLYVDGKKIVDEWRVQGNTIFCKNLVYLSGQSNIILDYFENTGGNQVGFSITPYANAANTIANTGNGYGCSGSALSLLNGSEFLNCITPTPGKSANVLFQWQISDNGTDFSNIAGATSEDYTPVAITTATAITRYFRRLVKAANSAEVQPLNSSNTIPIIIAPSTISTSGTVITGPAELCQGTATYSYSVSPVAGAVSYNWTLPLGWSLASLNGASTIVITAGQAAVSGSISVTINNGCVSSATLTKGVLVNAAPFAVTASASQAIICAGSSVSLTSSATINEQVFLINEKFNLATNNWNKINSSNNSGNRELSAWLLKPSGHTTFQDVIYSNDNSQFYISDSNAQNSTNGNTSTQLESPSFSLAGLSSATFTFYHFYRDWPDNSDNAKVQIRTNNGTTWTTWTDLVTYTSTQGANNNFALASINLNAYLGQAIVQVRFNYLGTNDYYWAVDNVQVSGIKNPAMSTGSYAWTSVPAGFTSNVMNPTSVAPTQTTTYTVTVSNGSACTTSASTTVTVNAASVGGTIAGGNTSICAGTSSVLTLSGKVGNVIRWESLTNPATSWIPIDNTTTILPTGPITSQIKFRAVVKNGICSEVFSEEATIVPGGQTTWKITAPATTAAWDNGTPDSSKKAIISADYAEAVDINACSLTVTDGAIASVPAGFIVTLESSLIVDSGSSLTFNSNAHLIQKGNTNQNIGNVTIKRNSSALKRLDYTLWSSPVIGSQSLADFSPATTANRFYNYNSLTDLYEVSSNLSSFNLAKGYLIRMPNNSSAITPTIYEGSFIGKPNSGDISIAMVNTTNDKPRRFNLVGNPYPSPISAIKFVEDNATNITGALYFWRKTNDSTQPSYYTWTTTGLTAPLFGIAADQTVVNVENYNKMIQTGQGFFVEAKGNATNLVFNNSMRTTNLTNQFFRAATPTEYNRIWLNATNAEGWISQTLIGYFTNGQDELDSSDGRYVNDGDIALTSIINEEAYAIQGKSLPFDPTDAIDLQLKVKKAGTYTIAIDHLDGLFEGSQEIFLRDTEIGTDHNLKLSSYVFTADAGTYNSRFKLVYQNYLGLVDETFNANTIAVAKKNNAISITAGSYLINSVQIFDLQGRKIYSKSNIDSSVVSITDLSIANQIILVHISTDNGTVTKKLQF